ncbi:hypothetical protein ELE36_02620 [Pseudolysobacter antarcticus]|uniref:Uncharacterized protein n=1 Tax=Pseudolysobacter antarcticus TaxID=2511995 RepID=A0A411HFS9_9GAMM|nr:hypothetical protein [Pseudolysobacter antarcticus]QBB69356.1 hypothetical protein ELE36_02620 [Pseudolysobacter antarcticus]
MPSKSTAEAHQAAAAQTLRGATPEAVARRQAMIRDLAGPDPDSRKKEDPTLIAQREAIRKAKLDELRKAIGDLDAISVPQAVVWLRVSDSTFRHAAVDAKTVKGVLVTDRPVYGPKTKRHGGTRAEDSYHRVALETWWNKKRTASTSKGKKRPPPVDPPLPIYNAIPDLTQPNLLVLRDRDGTIVAHAILNQFTASEITQLFREGGWLDTLSLNDAVRLPWVSIADRQPWLDIWYGVMHQEQTGLSALLLGREMPPAQEKGSRKPM